MVKQMPVGRAFPAKGRTEEGAPAAFVIQEQDAQKVLKKNS